MIALTSEPSMVGPARVMVLVTPRGDPLLVLDMELAGEPTIPKTAGLLAATCWEYERLTVAGRPVLTWLVDELGSAVPIEFGGLVHQCVFAGGALGDELLATTTAGGPAPAVAAIVLRVSGSPDRASQLGICAPPALNNPGETLLAHTLGVSLAVGWSRQVQNALALAAATTVSALAVLRRARSLAFDAFELNQTARLASTDDARRLVSELSDRLGEVQLDLSFGVEAYVDSVLISELVVESYQSSMRMASDLDVGLANTSRMVDRLASVIRARAAVLDAATQDERERRSRVFNVVLAVGSLIALPPSLLLAFFGVTSPDVDPTRSVLDLDRYWFAYGLAWLPFAVLLLAGFLLRRRIRRHSRLVRAGDQEKDPPGTVPSLVPSSRPPVPTQPDGSAGPHGSDHAGGGLRPQGRR
ncbi:MAG: hypothetical protein ACRDT2_16365 [Natronosporangium sp.]